MTRQWFNFRNLCLAALGLVTLGIASYPAWASLSVTPLIAVIEGRNRYADLNLINTSDKEVSYALEWRFMKMVEGKGTYENLDQSLTDFDLTQNIIVTPRRVTIEPSGMQKIRLGLRLKGEPPPPGDYRAHLLIREDQPPKPADPGKTFKEGEASIGVKVNIGFSIPVIYRVGESDATATIDAVRTAVNPNNHNLEAFVDVTRSGTRYGMLGHILLYHNDTMIGEVKNANLFDEITHRTFTIPLTVKEIAGGTLRVVYKHYDPQDKTVYAEKTVAVGN